MSQDVFDSIDPAISGTELAGVLNNFKAALVSGLSGTTRPVELEPGGFWVDTGAESSSGTWSFRLWTGSDDIEVFKIDLVNGGAAVGLAVDSFSVRKVSDDDVGAILELVKRRISGTGGQVQSGDVVGEIRMVGRQDNGSNPVVAKIVYTAAENQTPTAFGGTLSFHSTPAGTATLIEHMRFINGIIESLVPHKINSQELVAQSVATAATIAQLSADKAVVEMTGSTETAIQGINSGGLTKQITIHNRSSASVFLKHQDPGASANDRLLLPDDSEIEIKPQESVAMIYSVADSRWKTQYKSSKFWGFSIVRFYSSGTITTKENFARIVSREKVGFLGGAPYSVGAISESGQAYMWGRNTFGQLGDGSVTSKSSPVAVLGGLRFKSISISGNSSVFAVTRDGTVYRWGNISPVGPPVTSSPVAVVGLGACSKVTVGRSGGVMALTVSGSLYGWGVNGSGQAGTGDTTSTSVPTLVLGGGVFKEIASGPRNTYAISEGGDLYAWGENRTVGQVGDGTLISKSSPVAIASGIKFRKVFASTDGLIVNNSAYAISESGDLYAWGDNSYGRLGVGDTTARSTPTLVLGGHKFKTLSADAISVRAITEDGTMYAWGQNASDYLGIGGATAVSSPAVVTTLSPLKFKEVVAVGDGDAGQTGAIAVTEDGTMYSWGSLPHGASGSGTATISTSSPVQVLGGLVVSSGFIQNSMDIFVPVGNVPVTLSGGKWFVGDRFIGEALESVEVSYPS